MRLPAKLRAGNRFFFLSTEMTFRKCVAGTGLILRFVWLSAEPATDGFAAQYPRGVKPH